MKEFFEEQSLADSVIDVGSLEDFAAMEHRSLNDSYVLKNMTHRRQIEIMRENKILMSSIKDIYEF